MVDGAAKERDLSSFSNMDGGVRELAAIGADSDREPA
jgi:hypothetical protein